MTPLWTGMEVAVISSIEIIQTILNVVACMRMNKVKKNNNPHSMSCVNKFLQILRCSLYIGKHLILFRKESNCARYRIDLTQQKSW
jgi:hypothetical protein